MLCERLEAAVHLPRLTGRKSRNCSCVTHTATNNLPHPIFARSASTIKTTHKPAALREVNACNSSITHASTLKFFRSSDDDLTMATSLRRRGSLT